MRIRKRGEERRVEDKVWFLKRLKWPEICLRIVSSSQGEGERKGGK